MSADDKIYIMVFSCAFLMKHGYFLDLTSLFGVERVPEDDLSHVLLVKRDSEFAVGFGVGHSVQEDIPFRTLPPCMNALTRTDVERILSSVVEIMRNDPSYSTWNVNGRNSVNIHITRGKLEQFLDVEIEHQKRRQYLQYMDQEEISYGFIDSVRTERDVETLMSLLYPERREEFVKGFMKACRDLECKYAFASRVKSVKAPVVEGLRALQEMGFAVGEVSRMLNAVTKSSLPRKPPVSLSEWFRKYAGVAYDDDSWLKLDSVGSIERLPTTLHGRANKKFDPGIVTYRISEP